MKRFIFAVAATFAILVVASPAVVRAADAMHNNGGLGFHNTEAPIGLRWWFAGQKIGLDVGFGFESDPAPLFPDENLNAWAIEAGVPFVWHSWDRAHLLFRPGILYTSEEFVAAAPPDDFDTEDGTTFVIMGELEAEVFLVDNVSVSASHGIGFESFDPPGGGDSITSFSTFGRNFTTIGFHVYFFGGGQ
jgi:hypothetical protein